VLRFRLVQTDSAATERRATRCSRCAHVPGVSLPFAIHHGASCSSDPTNDLYVSIRRRAAAAAIRSRMASCHHTMNARSWRINVDGDERGTRRPGKSFAYATRAFPPEGLWAWGFRNPWRFSCDRQTGDLYIGRSEQDQWEEVDVAGAPNAANRTELRLERHGRHALHGGGGGLHPGGLVTASPYSSL